MTDQKSRWASKAAKYREWAGKAQARAVELYAPVEARRGDVAFFTQPGRIVERERMHARTQRAWEESQKARRMNEKAGNLERMATTNAGDALARHQAEDAAITAAVKAGDFVSCVYGNRCEVVKVNRKSLALRSQFGGTVRIDAHLCRKVEAA